MMYYTHVAGGVVCGGVAYAIMPQYGFIAFMGGAILGSLIPDLDHPNAFLNKRARQTSILTGFGHRTLTHSLVFAFLTLGVLLLGGVSKNFSMGLFIGMLSHLLLDSLNPTGVPLLYPYKKKYSIARFKTGGAGEYLTLFLCVGIICLYVYIVTI